MVSNHYLQVFIDSFKGLGTNSMIELLDPTAQNIEKAFDDVVNGMSISTML